MPAWLLSIWDGNLEVEVWMAARMILYLLLEGDEVFLGVDARLRPELSQVGSRLRLDLTTATEHTTKKNKKRHATQGGSDKPYPPKGVVGARTQLTLVFRLHAASGSR